MDGWMACYLLCLSHWRTSSDDDVEVVGSGPVGRVRVVIAGALSFITMVGSSTVVNIVLR